MTLWIDISDKVTPQLCFSDNGKDFSRSHSCNLEAEEMWTTLALMIHPHICGSTEELFNGSDLLEEHAMIIIPGGENTPMRSCFQHILLIRKSI